MIRSVLLFFLLTVAMVTAQPGQAQTRLAFKAAPPASPYYLMAQQFAGAVENAAKGELAMIVEDSHSAVENVEEAAMRAESYVFLTPPALIDQAVAGEDPFEPSEHYADIRALFPLPSLALHFVVRADSGIDDFAGLAGKDFAIVGDDFGFAAAKTADFFAALGLDGDIRLNTADAGTASSALENNDVQGFSIAGPYPVATVAAAAGAVPIKLLGLQKKQLELAAATPLVIPADTYPGVTGDVVTVALPVAAYALMVMEEETAYLLTRLFWENKDLMAETDPRWQAVTTDLLSTLGTVLHDGAARYYREQGIGIPAHLQYR